MPTPAQLAKIKAVEDFNQNLELAAKEEFLKFIEACRAQIELKNPADDLELILFNMGTSGDDLRKSGEKTT